MKTTQFFKVMAVLSPIMLAQTFSPSAIADDVENQSTKENTSKTIQDQQTEDESANDDLVNLDIQDENKEETSELEVDESIDESDEKIGKGPAPASNIEVPPKKPEGKEGVALGEPPKKPNFEEMEGMGPKPPMNPKDEVAPPTSKKEVTEDNSKQESDRFKIELKLSPESLTSLEDDTLNFISGIDDTLKQIDDALGKDDSDDSEFEFIDFDALLKEGMELKGDLSIAHNKVIEKKLENLDPEKAETSIEDLKKQLEEAIAKLEEKDKEHDKELAAKDAEIEKLKEKHQQEIAEKNREIKNLEDGKGKTSKKKTAKKKNRKHYSELDNDKCEVRDKKLSLSEQVEELSKQVAQLTSNRVAAQQSNTTDTLLAVLLMQMISQNQVSQASLTPNTYDANFAQQFFANRSSQGLRTGISWDSLTDSQERNGNTYNFYGSSNNMGQQGGQQQGGQQQGGQQQGRQQQGQMSATNPLTQFMQKDFSYNFTLPSQDRYTQMNAQNPIPTYDFTSLTSSNNFDASQALNQMVWGQ